MPTISGIRPAGMRPACIVRWPNLLSMRNNVRWPIAWPKASTGTISTKVWPRFSDIGPGGHYLGHAHTLENFQRAFFMPELFDNNSIEQWQAEGAVEITERALAFARNLLKDYEEPKLDPGVDEALRDYIARREREIPAADALNQTY